MHNHTEPGGSFSRRALLRTGLLTGAALAVAPQLPAGVRSLLTATPAAAAELGVHIVRRAEWGADESRRSGIPAYDTAVEKIVLHHTGTTNGLTDWAAQVRQIFEYETGLGYKDIAYHYLVDPNGTIYEGRWARDFPAGSTPDAEDAQGQLVRGGHALDHNSRTIGIALIGDYRFVAPSEAALASIVALLAWKCRRWQIDPLGTSQYMGGASLPNICGHNSVRVTECPGPLLDQLLPSLRERTAAALGSELPVSAGYWLQARDGLDVAFGGVPLDAGVRVAGVTAHPAGRGYWAFGPDGGVFAFGQAPFHGSAAGATLNTPIVGLASTRTGDGYWLVGADGGVFSFGAAPYLGSVAGTTLTAPIAGITATRSGRGYWLFGADGGVFAFGDASFHGSLAGTSLNAPIVDLTGSSEGYLLAARDGGVFAFGNAPYLGSGAPGPVVGVASRPHAYALLTADGQMQPFGTDQFTATTQRILPETIGRLATQ